MSDKELKHKMQRIRFWLVEIGAKLPPQFAEDVAILLGEITQRISETKPPQKEGDE